MLLLIIGYFVISSIRFTSSDCCGGVGSFDIDYPGEPKGLYMQCPDVEQRCCGDCTGKTPFCGYDGCNIFGCNCNCRAGLCGVDARRRLLSNGHDLTREDIKTWYYGNMTEFDAEFSKLDINKDDVLSLNEIDANSNTIIRGRRLLALDTGFNKWMNSIPDTVMLNQLSLPGTHDTMTYNADWIDTLFTFTQALSLEQNLNEGVRAFDIRCRHISNVFTIHHGPVYLDLNLDNVLNIFQRWLSANPTETVVVRFKLYEHTSESNTRSQGETFKSYLDRYPNLFYDINNDKIPTLGNARGKIVILCNSDDGSKVYGINYNEQVVQDDWDSVGDAKWTAIVNQMNKGYVSGKFNINYLSASSPPLTPLKISTIMNPQLFNVLYSNPRKFTGIAMMDYPPRGLIRYIINSNL